MDDLVDADFGKHDYDWLLTPPETPLVPSLDATDQKPPSTVSRGRSNVRSVSTSKVSRVSASQLQNGHSTKPARSNSLTRPSILNTYSSFSTYGNNSRTSILNTSIASVASRSSTLGSRSATTKPSPTSHPIPARSQTPAKARPAPTSPGVKTTKPHNSRSSTPTSRPQIPTNSNPTTSSSPRLHSRSSTPTRKLTNPFPAPTTGRATSVGRVRNPAAAATRLSSPSSRTHPPVQPSDIPDFPNDTPPNLRTRLPERPASAGRVRSGAALTTRANLNSRNVVSAVSNRRLSLPVSHSKLPEDLVKDQSWINGHRASPSEMQRSIVSDGGGKRTNKVLGTTESTGFGRTISKNSLDMAMRHMDIKQSMGGIRGTCLFPHSIRSNASKARPIRMLNSVVPVITDEILAENSNCNGIATPDCKRSISDNGDLAANKPLQMKPLITRESDFALYGNSQYDALLLKEDSNNMNWLHNIEDKSDQSPVFDHRFETLPEPFGLL